MSILITAQVYKLSSTKNRPDFTTCLLLYISNILELPNNNNLVASPSNTAVFLLFLASSKLMLMNDTFPLLFYLIS